jgi:hypothetical protein
MKSFGKGKRVLKQIARLYAAPRAQKPGKPAATIITKKMKTRKKP